MSLLQRLFAKAPFAALVEHTKKVHECVKLIRPLADALLAEDYDAIEKLHHDMSGLEHDADQIKDDIRTGLSHHFLLAVDRDDVKRYLSRQDDVADAAEDFAVVLRLRRTKMHQDLKEDFLNFVDKVIEVSERLLAVAEDLTVLAETAFTGAAADKVRDAIQGLSEKEWEADKLQRRFAMHYYQIEDQLDPVTVMTYDKYCRTLSSAANKAESTGKYLRNMIDRR